jgi:hypothetical protein
MAQISLHWDGSSVGDADLLTENAADGIGYRLANADYESPFIDRMMRAVLNGTGNRGVLANWLNTLAVTGAATPISVDTGAAIVYGLYYENDASLNVAITTPTNFTRNDYVVVRRNWANQEARITVIQGIEGGGVPSLTQSPAPTGTGIYDIPLATLEVDTLGNITVTDAREYVTYSTAAVADSITTATINNETVSFANRAQTVKNIRFGGGDLLSFISQFSYGIAGPLAGSVASTWGAAAATMDGWQATGTGSANDMLFHVVFKVPADFVPGTAIVPALWFIDDFAGASSVSVYSMWQAYPDDETVEYVGSYTSDSISHTAVVDDVHVVSLAPISGDFMDDDTMIMYCVRYYNSAGAESFLFNGIEFQYYGYV